MAAPVPIAYADPGLIAVEILGNDWRLKRQ
jgi:hypothetical protein